MEQNTFDHAGFYATYPSKVISRPGYPGRAVLKSNLLFKLFSKKLFSQLPAVKNYADIGGCFGFGANAMSYFIKQKQGFYPKTTVFEIESEFISTGKRIFPQLHFEQTTVEQWEDSGEVYDLFTLFDVIEHVLEPDLFLQKLSKRCRYLLIKTPMETSGEWVGSRAPEQRGAAHEDGHVNFFVPAEYEKLIEKNNFQILAAKLIPSIIPNGAENILNPEMQTRSFYSKLKLIRYPKLFLHQIVRDLPLVSWSAKRKILGGGEHVCLCKSTVQ